MKNNLLMKIGLKFVVVVIVLDLLRVFYEASALTKDIQGCYYQKVTNILPRKVSDCLLGEDYTVNKFACLLRCSERPFCRLACLEGNRCRQYSAAVSSYAKPSFSSDNPSTTLEGVCYSSWTFRGDLVPKIVNVKAMKGFSGREEDKAINGYYCNTEDKVNYYVSDDKPAYMEFELDSLYKISKLEIIVGNADYFTEAFVGVGNETGVGNNFRSQKEIGTIPNPDAHDEHITFTFPHPEYAKFMSLRTEYGSISVGDIKIL